MNEIPEQVDVDTTEPAVPARDVAAWEMIENGRYQPRRIKGSCLGRELG
jgi:hypothetical protein